jgi:hypothetical protein
MPIIRLPIPQTSTRIKAILAHACRCQMQTKNAIPRTRNPIASRKTSLAGG